MGDAGPAAPLTDEAKAEILAEAKRTKAEAKAKADKVIRAKKSAALGLATKPAAAPSKPAAGAKKPPAKPVASTGAPKPAGATSTALKPNKPTAKKKGAKKGEPSVSAADAAAPAQAEAAAPAAASAEAALTPEEREAQRKERERAREEAREEMERAIWEDERRIREREQAKRAALAAQLKLQGTLLEAAFDGELELIAKQLAAWQEACVSTLISAKLEFTDPNGHTMLSEAACAGHAAVCEALLDAGADVNTRNEQGRTPLWRAAFQGRAAAVSLLLERGGDPRIASSDAETPEMVAPDAALKQTLRNWDVARTDELLRAIAERDASQWRPPPPDPRDPGVPSGQPGYSASIAIQRFADVLEELTLRGERYPLVVDLGGKVLTYLTYRDVNLLNYCRPKDVEPDVVRAALVGALRYGKPLVVDFTLMSAFTLETLVDLFGQLQEGLFEKVASRAVLRPEVYESLLSEEERELTSDYRPALWSEETTAYFALVVLSKNPLVPEELAERFFVVKVA